MAVSDPTEQLATLREALRVTAHLLGFEIRRFDFIVPEPGGTPRVMAVFTVAAEQEADQASVDHSFHQLMQAQQVAERRDEAENIARRLLGGES